MYIYFYFPFWCTFSLMLLYVQKIDHDCFIVPRGAISVDSSKKVVPNSNYQGLSFSTSTELRAYMHMRKPENLQGIALLKRPGIVKSDDFLDCIDKDEPKGTFHARFVLVECNGQCLILFLIADRDLGHITRQHCLNSVCPQPVLGRIRLLRGSQVARVRQCVLRHRYSEL